MRGSEYTLQSRREAAVDSLMLFLIMDFVIRGHLWRILGGSERIYWICDNITYFFAYLTIFLLTMDVWLINTIMGVALTFAVNKVIESLISAESKFDWTEYLAFVFSVIYVTYKINGTRGRNK